MTPAELHAALAQMNPRAAQTLIFACVEGRPVEECAALYGVGLPQWEVLFFEAARGLLGQTQPLSDADRRAQATALASSAPSPLSDALASLAAHADEVQRLRIEAERAAALSPARARETWVRRVAVALIIGVSLFVWLRERNAPTPAAPSHNPLPPRKVG